MSVPFNPQGAWTALVTPFTTGGGLDVDAFKRLVEFQLSQGINGLLPTGTTGESPALTWEEHLQVIETTVKLADGKVGVLAGTGSNSTGEAVSATRHARESGASAALLVDCYYNKPSSLELRTEYYGRVLSDAPEIPIVPYVIPGRSVTVLSAADLAILHKTDPRRVPAVKEATGDLDRMREDRKLAGDSLAIMSGDDDMTLTMMQDDGIRAAGVISVMTNMVPAAIVEMVGAQRNGDAGKAGEIAGKLAPIFKLVGCAVTNEREIPGGQTVSVVDKFPNPVPIKTMMTAIGMPAGECRAPMGRMNKPGVDICRNALKEVYAAAPEYLKPINEAFGVDVEQRLGDDSAWAAVTRA